MLPAATTTISINGRGGECSWTLDYIKINNKKSVRWFWYDKCHIPEFVTEIQSI